MSYSFAVKRTSGLAIPARLVLAMALAVGLILSLVPATAARAATVRYVKYRFTGSGDCSSWANACTLQAALSVATSGDEIWVAQGTHTPGKQRTDTFTLKNGVAIYGGFDGTETARDQRDWAAHPTVLSGDLNGNGRDSYDAYHVVTGTYTDNTAVLDGFTVSGGNANGSNSNSRGGEVIASIAAGAITDLAGNPNVASTSTDNNVTFDPDGPVVIGLDAPDVAEFGAGVYTITVVYADSLAVDVSSLDDGDLRVTGPGGFDQPATFVGVTPAGDGTPRTATYRVTPPGGAWDDADRGTYTVALEADQVRDTLGNAAVASTLGTFDVDGPYRVFLPLVSRNYAVAPDLIVECITATGDDVQVVVKNRGNAPVADEFWVEVYVDPHPAPSAVNQLWYDLGDQGMFWGVVSPALPLAPGEAITLTYGDATYWPSLSRFDEALPAGTPVYAQVDAYNAATTYGAVRESHEIVGGAYNNVAGPAYSTGAATSGGPISAEPRATGRPQDVSRTKLPPLPGQ